MTHILEDLTHKMEGQPPKKEVSWVLGSGESFVVKQGWWLSLF